MVPMAKRCVCVAGKAGGRGCRRSQPAWARSYLMKQLCDSDLHNRQRARRQSSAPAACKLSCQSHTHMRLRIVIGRGLREMSHTGLGPATEARDLEPPASRDPTPGPPGPQAPRLDCALVPRFGPTEALLAQATGSLRPRLGRRQPGVGGAGLRGDPLASVPPTVQCSTMTMVMGPRSAVQTANLTATPSPRTGMQGLHGGRGGRAGRCRV
jgi:hypothetical protein